MTNAQKLKVLIATLFVFILVLVGMLVYAITVYKNHDAAAVTTSTSTASASASDSSVASATSTTVSQPSTGTASEVKETVDLKLYKYDAEDYDNPKEIVNVKMDKKLYQNDITAALNKLLEPTGLKINKAVVSGNLITVDLPKDIAKKFNSGSAGGITYTNILAMTMLNLPGIEKLEVTVDGLPRVEADHFSFNGTFTKTDGRKKYKLTASGQDSNSLDF